MPETTPSARPLRHIPWLVRGDIDGFFGLFIDNLVQLMVIAALCPTVCGIEMSIVTTRILPGAAVSILVGNVFYAWQARRLMRRTGRRDISALPYGINTPSVFAYIFLVMAPVNRMAVDGGASAVEAGRLAWQVGLLACLLSGVIETAGAFAAGWLRRHTPRAALLSALAGVAITFIAMGFVFRLFAYPEIGLLPMLVIVLAYASRTTLPLRVPAGLLAVLIGTALAWLLYALGWTAWVPGAAGGGETALGWHAPRPAVAELAGIVTSPVGWSYLAVVFPMGLFNVIGSLQNLESAHAAGDTYPTRSSLLANGLGTMAAALFGSAFPTTIYIGHPGWKTMGARAGYSVLNGLVVTALCLTGALSVVLAWVPMEAALGILLWIGIIITAQAFDTVPRRHALAVAFGLVPAMAGWARLLVEQTAGAAGMTLGSVLKPLQQMDTYLHGILSLDAGFLLTSMLWAAIMVFAIERQFRAAAAWAWAAAMLSATGIIHGYTITEGGFAVLALGAKAFPRGAAFAAMYAAAAVGLLLMRSAGEGTPAEGAESQT